MACSQNPNLLQCTGCHEQLNSESKTLPCLHSYCVSCLNTHLERKTNGDSQCPECHESLKLDQLSLSPFLANSLRRLQLETTGLKCDICAKKGYDSAAKIRCHDCQKPFCVDCNNYHKIFQPKHNARGLDEMTTNEEKEAIVADICSQHQKAKDLYCEQCNVCLCDTCYQKHSADSPGCSSRPMSVREEALKQKSLGPTLAKEMDDLKGSLRRLNENTRNFTEELKEDCDLKCLKVWQEFDEMMENAKQRRNELCEDMRQITAEQVERWHVSSEENENILKQLDTWCRNVHHLLNKPQRDVDVVCGLHLLRSKLSSQLHNLGGPEHKYELEITFPDWWQQFVEQLKIGKICSASLTGGLNVDNLSLDKQWNPGGINLNFSSIYSIYVDNEDNHVFLCDMINKSILEYTEGGEFVNNCHLTDGTGNFTPLNMCSITPDFFAVVCNENKIIILEKRKNPPRCQLKNVIDTRERFFSLCGSNETIFACNWFFQVDSFTKEGERIKTVKNRESYAGWPLIRADPSTGNFWMTRWRSSEIFCYNSNGEILRSVKTEDIIEDFCVNELGHVYFCNYEGFFILYPEKNSHKFEKTSEYYPYIYATRTKVFICLKIDGKYVIKVFKTIH